MALSATSRLALPYWEGSRSRLAVAASRLHHLAGARRPWSCIYRHSARATRAKANRRDSATIRQREGSVADHRGAAAKTRPAANTPTVSMDISA